jgi:rubrerythrin
MKLKKIAATLTMILMMATLPALALAEDAYGSAAVADGQTYTLEQMLTFAIQDEYAAQAEYRLILAAYGENNAFANIIDAEATHIEELTALFAAYGYALPANDAADRVSLPATLEEAYQTGVSAENANIAMYQNFLAQAGLPSDVRDVFADLQNASESHLTAFTRNADKDGNGMRNGVNDETQQNGNGNGLNDGNGQNDGNGNGQGAGNGGNAETCMDGRGQNRRTDVTTGQARTPATPITTRATTAAPAIATGPATELSTAPATKRRR